ncbi:O-acyltransferase [Sergentomyia squamirostris]
MSEIPAANNDNRGHARFLKDSVDDLIRNNVLKCIDEQVEVLKTEISRDVNRRLEIMSEQLINEVKSFYLNNTEQRNLFTEENLMSNRKPVEKGSKLPEKEFLARNSLLTDLLEVKHIKTIYNLFVVFMIIMFLKTVVGDLVADGRISFGLSPIQIGFGRFHLSLIVWVGMQTSISLLYYFFKFWAFGHHELRMKELQRKLWDYSFILGFVSFLIAFFTTTIRAVLYFDLALASSFAVLFEMCRFGMKAHAFIRSNAPKVLERKLKSNEDNKQAAPILPSFRTFQYFLFCPTLVYRESYPRTKEIRWKVAFFHFLDVFGVILFLSIIFERILLPNFNQIGVSEIELSTLVLAIFNSMMPATIVLILVFYFLLHAWLNGMAELLRFGDRMFYQDWWNSTSFSMFYRKWNVVVHDWLYTYIYKDLYDNVFCRNRAAATAAVFVVSAIFHEIILIFSFRFFYPVLFISFAGMGTIFMSIGQRYPRVFGNILVWVLLFIGNGLNYSLYSMEIYARKNCEFDDNFLNFFNPFL